jgi:hypothetical protein
VCEFYSNWGGLKTIQYLDFFFLILMTMSSSSNATSSFPCKSKVEGEAVGSKVKTHMGACVTIPIKR